MVSLQVNNKSKCLALSDEHAERMEEHSHITTVMSKQARKLAIGDINEFP